MGEILKINGTYYIEFYARGLKYSQIAGPDLAAAQKLLAETEAKIAGGESLTVVRLIELPAFFDQFLRFAGEEFGPRTHRRFADLIGHFQDFLSTRHPSLLYLSQITPSIVEDYKSSRRPSSKPHLVNFSILLLREMLEHGIKLGFINDNPTIHVRLLNKGQRELKLTKRCQSAGELLSKGVGIGKASKLLGLSDIARVMYYANFVPLSREDMYN
jgi:hypothetical protein